MSVSVTTMPFRNGPARAPIATAKQVLVCSAIAWTLASWTVPADLGAAQEVPRRPRLPRDADTNSATAYYQVGVQHLLGVTRGVVTGRTMRTGPSRPRDAYAAFYWASRIEPLSADALFGQYVALLLSDDRRVWRYMEADEAFLASAEQLQIDSLVIRGHMLDPFFSWRLIEPVLRRYLELRRFQAGRTTGYDPRYFLVREMSERYPEHAARVSFLYGEFQTALSHWARALRATPQSYWLHAHRAGVFFHMNSLDSARAEMHLALNGARAADAERMSFAYESKELWEYSLGWILERQGNLPGAGEAYQRALIENLAYHPAHLRLAVIAIRAADTVTALAELGRALALKEDYYPAQLTMGEYQLSLARHDSAAVHLRRAAELEPYAATPLLALGRALAAANNSRAAAEAYERFLALCRRDHPDRPAVSDWLVAFGTPRD